MRSVRRSRALNRSEGRTLQAWRTAIAKDLWWERDRPVQGAEIRKSCWFSLKSDFWRNCRNMGLGMKATGTSIPFPLHHWSQQQHTRSQVLAGWWQGRSGAQLGGDGNRCKHLLLHLLYLLLQTPRAGGSQPTENTSSWCWQFLRAYRLIPDPVKWQQTGVGNTGSGTFSSGLCPLSSPDTHRRGRGWSLALNII